MPTQQNIVQNTKQYDKFNLMSTNRQINRGHVELLKQSFTENGNLTMVQPILVNERHQIIDGQHRFQACKELEVPIYFTMVEGVGISHARSMNILQKNWTTIDFAYSYANEGRQAYKNFVGLVEDYPDFGHSVLLTYLYNGEFKGIFGAFRKGDLIFPDATVAEARQRLDLLSEATEIAIS